MINKFRKVMQGEKGFTLVEMMVVLIIIAVLIGLRYQRIHRLHRNAPR